MYVLRWVCVQVAAIEEQRRSGEVLRKVHEELAVLYNNHAAALKKAGELPPWVCHALQVVPD